MLTLLSLHLVIAAHKLSVKLLRNSLVMIFLKKRQLSINPEHICYVDWVCINPMFQKS